MYLKPSPASDAAARLFRDDVDAHGYVMNLSHLWAWRPEVCEGFTALCELLTRESSLAPRELAVLVCATAAGVGDPYCALYWGIRLAACSDEKVAAAVLRGRRCGGMTAREEALSAWARKVVNVPNATSPRDVDDLRAAGFAEREIFEATAFVAFRLAFSTINDALGAQPDWQLVAAAPHAVRSAVAREAPG